MANLFDISSKYVKLLDALESVIDNLGEDELLEEIAEDTIKELEIKEEEVRDKMEAYYYFIKQQEGDIQLLKDEQARLGDKIKTKENIIKRLKDNVNNALKLFGTKTDKGNYKLKTDKLSIWNVFHKPVVLDEGFYQQDYMNFKVKRSFKHNEITGLVEFMNSKGVSVDLDADPDMREIKADLKLGENIPGARIDTEASYVRFK